MKQNFGDNHFTINDLEKLVENVTNRLVKNAVFWGKSKGNNTILGQKSKRIKIIGEIQNK